VLPRVGRNLFRNTPFYNQWMLSWLPLGEMTLPHVRGISYCLVIAYAYRTRDFSFAA
jgi:hypothetical protein